MHRPAPRFNISTRHFGVYYGYLINPLIPNADMVRYYRNVEVEHLVRRIIDGLELSYIDKNRVYVVVSRGSKARACARIHGMSKVFSFVGFKPAYVIELIEECFVKLSCIEAIEVIIHELMHIPFSFSGSLRPHGRYTSQRNIRNYTKKLGNIYDLCRYIYFNFSRNQ